MTTNKALTSPLDEYSGSSIIRRCGQLGIPYADAIQSPYARQRGWKSPNFKVQYKDGVNGTIGWGNEKRPIPDSYSTPHSFMEMKVLLGITTKQEK